MNAGTFQKETDIRVVQYHAKKKQYGNVSAGRLSANNRDKYSLFFKLSQRATSIEDSFVVEF